MLRNRPSYDFRQLDGQIGKTSIYRGCENSQTGAFDNTGPIVLRNVALFK